MLIFKEEMIGVKKDITLLIVYENKKNEKRLDPAFYQATRNLESVLDFRYAKEMNEIGIADDEEVLDYLCGNNFGIANEWEHRAIIADEQLYADEYLAFKNAN